MNRATFVRHIFAVGVIGCAPLLSHGDPPPPALSAPTTRVLILPFVALNDPAKNGWIGTALQQNIVADFAHSPSLTPVAYAGAPTSDTALAVQAAQAAHADTVIFGTTQVVEDQTRLTALAVNVRSGQLLGSAKVTAPSKELLHAEDTLSSQLHQNFFPEAAGPSTAALAAAPAAASSQPSFSAPNLNATAMQSTGGASSEIPYPPSSTAYTYTPGISPPVATPAPSYEDNSAGIGPTYYYSDPAAYPAYPYYSSVYGYPSYGGLYTSFVFLNGRYYRYHSYSNGYHGGGGYHNGYANGGYHGGGPIHIQPYPYSGGGLHGNLSTTASFHAGGSFSGEGSHVNGGVGGGFRGGGMRPGGHR